MECNSKPNNDICLSNTMIARRTGRRAEEHAGKHDTKEADQHHEKEEVTATSQSSDNNNNNNNNDDDDKKHSGSSMLDLDAGACMQCTQSKCNNNSQRTIKRNHAQPKQIHVLFGTGGTVCRLHFFPAKHTDTHHIAHSSNPNSLHFHAPPSAAECRRCPP